MKNCCTKIIATVVALVLNLMVVIPSYSAVESGVIKFAHSEAEIDILTTPYYVITSVFKSIVETETNGRWTVQAFPNHQLGDVMELMEQCARGTIQMTTAQNPAEIASVYPKAQLLEMPYAFSDLVVARKFLEGSWTRNLNEEMAKTAGIRPLTWMPSAFRSYANNVKEVKIPDDMKGLKIRVQTAPIHVETAKALGAMPTPIPWGELYTAVQTKVVDGYDNAPYGLLLIKLEEITKFFTLDNHCINVMPIIINEKFYQSLTPTDKRIINHAAREASIAFLGLIRATEARDLNYFTSEKGIKVTSLGQDEFKQFRDLAQPAIVKMLGKTLGESEVKAFLDAVQATEKDAY
jgi:tripartite ATP-independent transporter DctP family solute receptor